MLKTKVGRSVRMFPANLLCGSDETFLSDLDVYKRQVSNCFTTRLPRPLRGKYLIEDRAAAKKQLAVQNQKALRRWFIKEISDENKNTEIAQND